MFTPVTGNLTVRTLAEPPGEWWDDLCRRARSPWLALGPARLQEEFGVEPVFLAAFEAEAPVAVLSVFVAGSRRLRALDPVFARTAFVPDEPAGDVRAVPALVDALEAELDRRNVVSAVFRVELPRCLKGADLESRGWVVETREQR
jgi:hypothetical protein